MSSTLNLARALRDAGNTGINKRHASTDCVCCWHSRIKTWLLFPLKHGYKACDTGIYAIIVFHTISNGYISNLICNRPKAKTAHTCTQCRTQGGPEGHVPPPPRRGHEYPLKKQTKKKNNFFSCTAERKGGAGGGHRLQMMGF